MLQTHLIAELLGMEAFDFEKIDQDEKEIVLTVRMQRRTQECPACHTPCDQIHDYRIQRVKDSPIQECGRQHIGHIFAGLNARWRRSGKTHNGFVGR